MKMAFTFVHVLALAALLCGLAVMTEAVPATTSHRGRHNGLNRALDRPDLVTLIPQQSCYYQRHNKQLICNCNSTDTSAYVLLNMKFYVFNAGEEIGSVHLKQCKELLVTLDLRQVDATKFPVHFRAINKVEIEKIMFEPKYSDRQELQLVFDNVEQLIFKKIFVEDTLKLRATNVKEARFVKSTFAHIPQEGFQVSRARVLDIRDSYFLRVSPRSIVVEKTKEVTVLKNEMTINALDVVYAKDGTHLMISCNRLLGQPISPECSKITTTTSTTTTTTPPPYYVNQGNLRKDKAGRGEGGDGDGSRALEDMLPELIGGAVAGVVIISLALVFFACIALRKRSKRQEGEYLQAAPIPSPQKEVAPEEPIQAQAAPAPAAAAASQGTEREAAAKASEADSLLEVGPEGDDTDDDKPKFSSPIWLEEIHKNRIFNKQKSLLSEEGLKDIAEGKKAPAPKPPQKKPTAEAVAAAEAAAAAAEREGEEPERPLTPPPDPADPANLSPAITRSSVNGEVKESSRTESAESDEDDSTEKQQPPKGNQFPLDEVPPPVVTGTTPVEDVDSPFEATGTTC